MLKTHITQSFAVVQYSPKPEVAAFIDRLQALLENPEVTDDEMVDLIYGVENPVLETDPLFPSRRLVTQDVLKNPAYLVITDMLARKESIVRIERARLRQKQA